MHFQRNLVKQNKYERRRQTEQQRILRGSGRIQCNAGYNGCYCSVYVGFFAYSFYFLIMNKNKKYEYTKNPLRINEVIRKEYPWLVERMKSKKQINGTNKNHKA